MAPIDYAAHLRPGVPNDGGAVVGHIRQRYDFATGHPDPVELPLDELVAGLQEALGDEGRTLAWYPHPLGYPPLRDYLASKLRRDRRITCSADQLILGDGSSQPIAMVLYALLEPGDVVLCESFTYGGTLSAIRRMGAQAAGVECDEVGLIPDALDAALRRHAESGRAAKLVYTIPTFQNPLGTTADEARRGQILEVAQRNGVPILEDDCYVDLRYEGEVEPAIRALDEAGETVIYVGSFSKIIGPGMRLGYVLAPDALLLPLASIKTGGGVNQFAAMAVHRLADQGKLDEHIAQSCNSQRAKRDAMWAAMESDFADAATWSRPQGGIYLWVHLKDQNVDTADLVEPAVAHEVGITTGVNFHPEGTGGSHHFRLCFGFNTPEEIAEGVSRLAAACADVGVAGVARAAAPVA